jgi:hypothetical protein
MPFTLANPLGRLVEIRIHGLMNLEEAQQIRIGMYLLLSALPHKAIIFTDMIETEQFSAEVGERMLEMLTHDNPKVERTGFVMRKGPFALKIERICMDAARAAKAVDKTPPQRRVFFDKDSVYGWLSEALSPAERSRLSATIEHIMQPAG